MRVNKTIISAYLHCRNYMRVNISHILFVIVHHTNSIPANSTSVTKNPIKLKINACNNL